VSHKSVHNIGNIHMAGMLKNCISHCI